MKSHHGGNVFELARELHCSVQSLVDFSANINPLGPPAGWKELLLANMDALLHYPDASYETYRLSIANRFGLEKSQVIAGNGVADLIWLYARTVRPSKVVILSPTFGEYESAFRPWSKEIVHLVSSPRTSFQPDLIEIASALGDAELLILCNPNNPTGTLLSSSLVDRLIELTAERGIKFMIDESFIEFATNACSVLAKPIPPHLFVLRSQTKIGAVPGLRVGYAVSTDIRLIEELNTYGDSWPMNTLAAAFGSFLENQTDFFKSTQTETDRLRSRMEKALFETGAVAPFPSSANFVLCRILGSITAEQLCERAKREGILIRNAQSFVGLSNRFVRLAVRPENEQDRLISFLQNIG